MSCRKDAVDMAFGARGLCCERLIFVGVLGVPGACWIRRPMAGRHGGCDSLAMRLSI